MSLLTAGSLTDANNQVADFQKSDVDFILKNIKPGDVMIQRSFDLGNIHTTAISGAITGGRYTHSVIYLGKDKDGNRLVAESVGGGPKIASLTQYLQGRNDVMIIRPPYKGDQKSKALKYARDWAEKPSDQKDYDIWGNNNSDDKFYCTELVYKALEHSGVKLPKANNGKLSPALFFLPPLGAFNHLRKGGPLIGADTFKYMEGGEVIFGGRKNLPKHPFLVAYSHDISIKVKKVLNFAVDKVVDLGHFIGDKSKGVGKFLVDTAKKGVELLGDAYSFVKGLFSKEKKQVFNNSPNSNEFLKNLNSNLIRTLNTKQLEVSSNKKIKLSAGQAHSIRQKINAKSNKINVLIRENRLDEVKKLSLEIIELQKKLEIK